MIMEDDVWYIVRNTPEIQGIVGSHGNRSKPTPLTKEEIDVVFKKVGIKNSSMAISNLEGKRIKLLAGGFIGMEATIVSVDIENQSFTVELIYFGRKKVVVVNSSEAEILM
jgi:transcriptional antiterminator NusG